MDESFATGLVAAYYAVLALLCLYGVHRLRLLLLLRRPQPGGEHSGDHSRAGDLSGAGDLGSTPPLPRVTVQLPIFNELCVAPRLLAAVSRLDYPRDLLEIQVLDDSTDETSAVLAKMIEQLQAEGHAVRHMRRQHRRGYKAGALEVGLQQASGELIAIFDADFVPPPDFLLRSVPHFGDPEVGMVQAAWDHLNRDDSLLTRIQALLLDGHFQVEHQGRSRGALFFNFNGTAGTWRRSAIEDAGGWQHDTLTEDLDLSYRAQLAGWRFVFLPDLLVPSELPIDIAAFKTQQHRWTHGSAQTLRKLAARLLLSPLSLPVKLEALIHLSSNLCYPLMVALALLMFPAMSVRREIGDGRLIALDLTLFGTATLSIIAFYVHSQVRLGLGWRDALRLQVPLMALGTGMSLHNARAAVSGLFLRGGVFVRTPKNRFGGLHQRPDTRRRWSSWPPLTELLMIGYLTTCVGLAISQGVWWSLPFLCLFLGGYLYIAGLGVWPPPLRWRKKAPQERELAATGTATRDLLPAEAPAVSRIAS